MLSKYEVSEKLESLKECEIITICTDDGFMTRERENPRFLIVG